MQTHKVKLETVNLKYGVTADIKYWTDKHTVYVAAFDLYDNQLSVATYQAPVEFADDFFDHSGNKSLIQGLSEILKTDLLDRDKVNKFKKL